MATLYTDKHRETKRVKFAKGRRKGHSIKVSSAAAGISPSTARSWNKGSGWDKGGSWDKTNGWGK